MNCEFQNTIQHKVNGTQDVWRFAEFGLSVRSHALKDCEYQFGILNKS